VKQQQPFVDMVRDSVCSDQDGLERDGVAIRPRLRGNWHLAGTTYAGSVDELLNQLDNAVATRSLTAEQSL
jgi:hypothetical protein